MTDPVDPTDLLRASDPAKSFRIDPSRIDAMLSRVTEAPPVKPSPWQSWKVRTASALAAAAAVGLPVALTLSGGSTPPVLNFAATALTPRSSAAPAAGTRSALPFGAPIAEFKQLQYSFVAGSGLKTTTGSADVYSLTGGADPGSTLMALSQALGIANGTETSSDAGWTITGANAMLTGTSIRATPPTPLPIPLEGPKTTMLPQLPIAQNSSTDSLPASTKPAIAPATSSPAPASSTLPVQGSNAGGATGSGGDPTVTTAPRVASSTSIVTSTTTTAPGVNTPVSWSYSPNCSSTYAQSAGASGSTLGVAVAEPCVSSGGPATVSSGGPATVSSGGPATTASNDQLVSWSRPLVATIEAMNLVPAPASLGTPTVDPTAGTISYPYDFSAGAALGSVSDPLGISTDLTFRFGGTGSLVYASGLLFATARLDTYPLVSETLAVGSLTAGDLVGSGIVYPGGIMKAAPTTQGPTVPQKIPGDTGTTSTIPPTAGSSGSGTGVSSTPADSTSTSTLPPDTTPATTVPVATMPIETLPISSVPVSSVPVSSVPVSSVPVSSVPVDSVPAAPTTSTVPVITTLPNQPSSVTETLQSASLGYAIELLTNGDAVLVPTYTFTASDGSLWRIVALDPADFRAAPVRS